MEFNRIEDKANKSVTTIVKKKQVETELYSESYVFDEQGKIIKIMPKVKPDTNAADVLALL